MTRQVLVAGIGNVFFGDDGFGVAVADRLVAGRPPPDGVRFGEYGIRGVHLAYELLDGYDTLVLVDAVPMDEPAGTLALLEAEVPSPPAADHRVSPRPSVEAHSMTPDVVLGVLATLGGRLDGVYVVGCRPGSCEPGMELSPPVAAAVDPACALVGELLEDLTGPMGASVDSARCGQDQEVG